MPVKHNCKTHIFCVHQIFANFASRIKSQN